MLTYLNLDGMVCIFHAWIKRGGGVRMPLGNHKAIGSYSNTGPDPLKNHKATKPAFRWIADDDPLLVVFESSLSSSAK